jgi:hypothetical protein
LGASPWENREAPISTALPGGCRRSKDADAMSAFISRDASTDGNDGARQSPVEVAAAVVAGDALVEIDHIMQKRLDDETRSAEHSAQIRADRAEFSVMFTQVCADRVRPEMEEVLGRLRKDGGGGLIEEQLEDLRFDRAHRLTLWMSLSDEITGSPRQDRHPYLRLEADVGKRCVIVSEGDMWQGHGGNSSGRTGAWQLSEITGDVVAQEAVAILRRSVG